MVHTSKPKLNLSLDIETTGLKPGCGVWQIGCVAVEMPEHSFCVTVDPIAVLNSWPMDGTTVKWQQEKNRENWELAHLHFDCQEVITALVSFADWYRGLAANYDIRLWTKGPHFDIAILDAAYDRIGHPSPWKYNSIRDMRTLESLFPDVQVPKPDGAHNALVDAKHQAEVIRACLEDLDHIRSQSEQYHNQEMDKLRHGE